MGKYSGRVLAMYIAHTGVRICDGKFKTDENDYIRSYFTVAGVEEFFTKGAGGRYDVTNMSGLVNAITTECDNQHISTRRIFVCSDCFDTKTTLSCDKAKSSLASFASADLFSKDKGKKDKDSKAHAAPDRMHMQVDWGTYLRDGTMYRSTSETDGDKFTLRSLVGEFYRRGYSILGITDTAGAMLNFKDSRKLGFDSQGCLLICMESSFNTIPVFRGTPLSLTHSQTGNADEVIGHLDAYVRQALETVGRNPRVYLAGDVFRDVQLYADTLATLRSLDCIVEDEFELQQSEQVGAVGGDMAEQLTPDYSLCLALLRCSKAKKVISLLPSVDFEDVFRKNAKTVAAFGLMLSIASFGVASTLAIMRVVDKVEIKNSPSRVSNFQNQLSTLSLKRVSLDETLMTLTQADSTVLDLLNFIEDNKSPEVAIVSVDTRDMLTTELSVDAGQTLTVSAGTGTEPTDGAVAVTPPTDGTSVDATGDVTGGTPITESTREPILLRGYARTGPAAVSYFNKLFNAGLHCDPVLNGVEKYILPAGDEVYIFEIEVGGATANG